MATLQTVLVALERRIPGAADREDMVDAINIALSEVGHVTLVDETLTVVDDQTEYDLPSGVANVVRVQIANSSTTDYDYATIFTWREINGKLYLPDELGFSAGNKIRIYYNNTHDSVEDDTDTISDDIPIPMLVKMARYEYEFIQYQDQSNMGAKDEAVLERLLIEKMTAQQNYRINRIPRDPILGSN
jgi:hypothetical protein